ncbi:FliH/SctL family protein [Kineosporia succinea]|uniref:Flagellar assembly protein FliH n=1 Tax=Kineosporia succinea TaxID=84632 RepID=A0ABT9P336_9ACTN|nr:FliH/SctL family protein [Kineosporia succinea]MDP9826505.1 flagellar assembly protein FliH [Kineosporia succinea]
MSLRQSPSPVLSPQQARDSVRPANLDRPLHRTSVDPQYGDPRLEEMVRQASARAREEAQAQGYLAGWAQGRQAAAEENVLARASMNEENARIRDEVTQQVHHLLQSMRDAVRQAHEATLPQWKEVADVLTDGALQLAAAALGRELQSVDGQVELAVRSALRHVGASDETVVHLHPDDARMLEDDAVEGVTVVPDATLSPGDVTVLTPTQRLRQDLPGALAAAEEVLRG